MDVRLDADSSRGQERVPATITANQSPEDNFKTQQLENNSEPPGDFAGTPRYTQFNTKHK